VNTPSQSTPGQLWNQIARKMPQDLQAEAADRALRLEIIGAVGALAYGYLADKTWSKVVGFALGAGAAWRIYQRHVPPGPLVLGRAKPRPLSSVTGGVGDGVPEDDAANVPN
jgi:hypothetical protein